MNKRIVWMVAVCGVAVAASAQSYSYGGAEKKTGQQKYSYEAPSSHVAMQQGRTTPFMLAIFDPVQVPPSDWDVAGLRLSILYGKCNVLKGLDIGLVNESDYLQGIQIGIVNADGDVAGIRISGLYGDANVMKGLDIGLFNACNALQGWQIGLFNTAKLMKGLQLGVVNHAEQAIGVQIGLVNIIEDKDIPFLPIINASF